MIFGLPLGDILDDRQSLDNNSNSTLSSLQTPSEEIQSDFNGDGRQDLAIGIPHKNIDGSGAAGAVLVIYNTQNNGLLASPTNNLQLWSQNSAGIGDTAEFGDFFGDSLASGDFNNDGFHDLAIGASEEDSSTRKDTGSVNIIYGSDLGLSATRALPDQITSSNSQDFQWYGATLEVGDFNNDGFDDLVIGIPRQDIGTAPDAGAIRIVYGSSSGLFSSTAPVTTQLFSQSSRAIDSNPEAFDEFGTSLSSGDYNSDGFDDLVIGVPNETPEIVSTFSNAGVVHIIYGGANGLCSIASDTNNCLRPEFIPEINEEDTFGKGNFGLALATGDFNGNGTDDLAIGEPGISFTPNDFPTTNAGIVRVFDGSTFKDQEPSFQLWHQNVKEYYEPQFSNEILDTPEGGDGFGSSLAAADFNGDRIDDLAVGAMGESISNTANAGAVNIIYGSENGLSVYNNQFWSEDEKEVNGTAEVENYFGYALLGGDYDNNGLDDLVIGSPFEKSPHVNFGRGQVNILYSEELNGISSSKNDLINSELITSDLTEQPSLGESLE
jgi:hypothetical protein